MGRFLSHKCDMKSITGWIRDASIVAGKETDIDAIEEYFRSTSIPHKILAIVHGDCADSATSQSAIDRKGLHPPATLWAQLRPVRARLQRQGHHCRDTLLMKHPNNSFLRSR